MPALDPVVYFFLLGLLAGFAKADLRLPPSIYEFVSTVLLLAIGLKGGVELARHATLELAAQVPIVIGMGVVLALLAFAVLRYLGRFDLPDAASIAAHYGSVSVGTFAVGVAFLASANIPYEPQLSLFLVLLEVPAILVGIVLARGAHAGIGWGRVLHEAFLGRSVLLLLGGLVIGWAAGEQGVAGISPLFIGLFKGILALFLLEMGLIATQHIGGLRKHGVFLAAFAIVTPVVFGTIGAFTGSMLGLSVGGTTLLATLAGSASYIAAPAAMRTAVPQADPGLSLAAALALTFPFNILIGIPLYQRIAQWIVT
jgi:hypothetical protein